MTAPAPERRRAATVVRLPTLDDERIPAWRLTRHAVAIVLATFAMLVVGALVAAALVTMRLTVDGDGLLEPVDIWPIRSLESGVLTELLVQAGDTVSAGQVIARLDSVAAGSAVAALEVQIATGRVELRRLERSLPVEVARLRAGVVEAEAHLARARTALRERMALFGVTGDADSLAHAAAGRVHVGLDTPSAELVAAEGRLAASRAQLSGAMLAALDIERKRLELELRERELATSRVYLHRRSIVAPASGVVLTDQTERLVGSAVVAGQPFLEIADLGLWRATLAVREKDVHRVRTGDEAIIEIPAFASLGMERFRGRVEAVGWQPAAAAEGPSGSRGVASGYRVLVRLDSDELGALAEGMLRRGYVVRGRIVTRSAPVLTVIGEFLRARMSGGGTG